MDAFPTLQTPRLLLREIVEADAPALLAIHGDVAHMQWFGADPPADLDAAQGLVRLFAAWRRQAHPGTRWGLALQAAPGQLIGSCGLFAWHRGWRKCALGYELAAQVAGQGLMHEALSAILPWGLRTMGLNRIEAQVHAHNAPSRALLSRLGFAHEGDLRQVAYWGGQHHDLQQWSLLARDWPPTPAARPAAAPAAQLDSLLRTLVLYALAEVQAGHARTIRVTADGAHFSLEDDGRGHPVDRTVHGQPYLPFIYRHLDYPFAAGAAAPVQLQGLGMSLVNALCTELTLTARRPDTTQHHHYRHGQLVHDHVVAEHNPQTGNRVDGIVRLPVAGPAAGPGAGTAAGPGSADLGPWLQRLLVAHPGLHIDFNGQALQPPRP